jgi:hypothetical protein
MNTELHEQKQNSCTDRNVNYRSDKHPENEILRPTIETKVS